MPYSDPVERVRAFIKTKDPALKPVEYPETTGTADAAARTLGVELGQIAKSILSAAVRATACL